MIQIFGRARRAALGLDASTDRSAVCCPYGGPANRLYAVRVKAKPTEDRAPQTWGDESKSPEDSEVEAILTPTTVSSLAAARAALEQLEVADKANSRPSETVDLDEDVVARNTLAETNIARSTSRASNDSNRISIASQEDFKF